MLCSPVAINRNISRISKLLGETRGANEGEDETHQW